MSNTRLIQSSYVYLVLMFRWIDRWMDGWMDGRIDGWLVGCSRKNV